MIDRVLVPMDESEMAGKALEYALEVHDGAEITVLYVAGQPSAMMGQAVRMALETDLSDAANEAAKAVFEDAREMAADYDVTLQTEVTLGSPAAQIIEHAGDHDAVVMGSHSSNLRETLFTGNIAEKVSTGAPVPVTLVR